MSSPKNPQNNDLAESIKTAIILNSNRTSLVSWLFLVGLLVFLADGFLEKNESIFIYVVFYLAIAIPGHSWKYFFNKPRRHRGHRGLKEESFAQLIPDCYTSVLFTIGSVFIFASSAR